MKDTIYSSIHGVLILIAALLPVALTIMDKVRF
jgi:hypothetical protein